MSKRNSIIVALIASVILCLSYSSNPPNGKTGAPGEGVCNECHTGSNPGLDGDISISGLPTNVDPNTTYPITITLTNPNGAAARGGFQWVALDSNSGNAGSMANASPMSAVMISNGRSYHEHNGMNPFVSPLSWTVDWTSPTGPAGDVITLYSRGNIGNGIGNSNDRIVSMTAATTLNAALIPPTPTIAISNDLECFNDNSGIAEVSVSGGTTPYLYLWSNGSTTNPATDLPAGTSTVTVSDSGGMTGTTSVVLNEPTMVEVDEINIIDQICLNASNGFIEVEGSGGTPGYMYLWSTGATTHWIANLSAGDYMVTVTDANGCTASDNYSIAESGLAVDIIGASELCDGESLVLSASGNFNLYNWSTGSIGPSTMVNSGGNVILTVTDNNGCTGSSVVQINILSAPNPIIQGPSEVCSGLVNTLTIPTSFTTYLWSDGSNLQSIDITDCGTYSATVSDANGCTAIASKVVTCSQPFEITLLENQSISCIGENDGLLEIGSSISTNDVDILWSTGETSSLIDNLPQGNYTVTMTDNSGCTDIGTYIIEGRDTLNLVIDSLVLPKCHDDSTSLVIVSAFGGTAPYSFFWPNNISGDTITQFGSGNYQITMVDGNSCVDSVIVTIPEVDSLEIILEETTHVLCNGSMTGSLEVSATGGHGSEYEFFWDNGVIDSIVSGLAGGFYSVFAVDSLGCGVADTFEILENISIVTTATISNESQTGLNDGWINLIVTGGGGNYNYLWSNGATSTQNNDLSPGIYTVTINDGLGCSIDTSFLVGSMGCNLQLFNNHEDAKCYNGSDGTIAMIVTNAITPLDFIYSDNILAQNIDTDGNLSNLKAGQYAISVVDAVGCSNETTVTITEPEAPTLTLSTTNVSCYGEEDGSIAWTYTNLVEPITYQFSENIVDEELTNLSPGNYSITIVDGNQCTISAFTSISEQSEITPEIFVIADATCDNSADGSAIVFASGGTGTYSYAWSNGNETSSITELPGSYSVTISDAQLCTAVASIDIGVDDNIPPTLVLQESNLFIGLDGEVILPELSEFVANESDNCGTIELNYINPPELSCISATYDIIIEAIDNSGNTSQDTTQLSVIDIVAPQLDCPTTTIFGACQEVIYEVGVLDNCNGAGLNLVSGLASSTEFPIGVTTIVYEAIDASENISQCTFDIEVLPELTISELSDITICFGETVTIDLIVEGGSGDYTVTINGQDPSIALGTGIHTANVSDSSGCSSSTTFEITENPEIIASVSESVNESIINTNDGLISISASGGTGPLSYNWFKDDSTLDQDNPTIADLAPGTYSVQIIDANGCSTLLDNIIINEGVTSNSDDIVDGPIFQIFPNPVIDELNIQLNGIALHGNIKITNLSGSIIQTLPKETRRIDVNELDSGIYFISIRTAERSLTKKWIKL